MDNDNYRLPVLIDAENAQWASNCFRKAQIHAGLAQSRIKTAFEMPSIPDGIKKTVTNLELPQPSGQLKAALHKIRETPEKHS